MSGFYPAVAWVAAISLGIIATSAMEIDRDLRAQTVALERIADELKPPLHSETTITHIDPVVCDTLGNALKDAKHKGTKP